MELLLRRTGRSFTTAGRPAVRWISTDHDRAGGRGPEVRGELVDLALAAAGRRARLGLLEGAGTSLLQDWLRRKP